MQGAPKTQGASYSELFISRNHMQRYYIVIIPCLQGVEGFAYTWPGQGRMDRKTYGNTTNLVHLKKWHLPRSLWGIAVMKSIPLRPSVHQSLVSVLTCWIYSAMNHIGKFFENIIFKRDDCTVNYRAADPFRAQTRDLERVSWSATPRFLTSVPGERRRKCRRRNHF